MDKHTKFNITVDSHVNPIQRLCGSRKTVSRRRENKLKYHLTVILKLENLDTARLARLIRQLLFEGFDFSFDAVGSLGESGKQ